MLIGVFRAVYVAHIYNMVDENRYIRILQVISESGFKTYHIQNFDKLFLHLRNQDLQKSYIVSILFYFRDENYQAMTKMSDYFGDIRQILISNKYENATEKVKCIHELLSEKLFAARAFVKVEKMQIIHFAKMAGAKLDDQTITKEWFRRNRQDIMNRLHQLLDLFSLDQLRFMGVELLRVNTLCSMSEMELQSYYDKSIENVIRVLTMWVRSCALYMDTDNSYRDACKQINMGYTPRLKLESFNIRIIRRKNLSKQRNSSSTRGHKKFTGSVVTTRPRVSIRPKRRNDRSDASHAPHTLMPPKG